MQWNIWRINPSFEFVNLMFNKSTCTNDFVFNKRWINKHRLFLKAFEIFLKVMQWLWCKIFPFFQYCLQKKDVAISIVNKEVKRSPAIYFMNKKSSWLCSLKIVAPNPRKGAIWVLILHLQYQNSVNMSLVAAATSIVGTPLL